MPGYTPVTLDGEDAKAGIIRKTTVLDVMRRLLQVRGCQRRGRGPLERDVEKEGGNVFMRKVGK